MALSPSAFHRAPIDTDKRLRGELGLPPGAPVNLWSVLDTGRTDGSRPKLSLPMLAQLAIHGSENRMLTLQGIMQAIKDRFRWYHETTDKGWQNSMRHALSLYSVFVRVERPVHHAGKGAYWTLSTSFDDQYDQYKRLRKRAGNEKQTPKIASNRVASPNVTANVCSPVPAPPSLEHRQNSPSPMPDKHDASEHSEWAQANIDPKLLDRPSSFISYQTNASSNRDVNYVAGTQEQSIEAAPADRAEISTSRRLLSRSDSFKLPSSDPASTSPTASKKGRHTRA
ncbi:hypothetical protein DFH07DRAFT_746967 [Mycena maculata]|uniref:Fork-head domain-containing protein n=1 Tax=Mycena maculata TaxID=230809 RepID=A0AAD7N7M9_9AGAR|nr:hypothetical protein DFH07DRAFT_746967 [Mycena maculata]